MSDWDQRFLDMAQLISTWSRDRARRVGAVIVGPKHEVRSCGYNGFPPGVREDIEARHVKPEKLLYVEHAERNAVYFAASIGVPLEGCTLYCTSMPCADCARAVIRSGITRVVIPSGSEDFDRGSSWFNHWMAAQQMLMEAKVDIVCVKNALDTIPSGA